MGGLIRSSLVGGLLIAAVHSFGAHAENVLGDVTIAIETRLPGAGLEMVASQIARPLEFSLGRVSGVEALISSSRAGQNGITLKFRSDWSKDAALSQTREQIVRAREQLPRGIVGPHVNVVEDGVRPVAYLAFFNDSHTALEATRIVTRTIMEPLSTVDGIVQIRLLGGRRIDLLIRLDLGRLAAYGLSRDDVVAALRKHYPRAHSLNQDDLTLLDITDPEAPEKLSYIIIKVVAGAPISLADIGTVEPLFPDSGSYARFNGRNAIIAEVIGKHELGLLQATRAIRDALPQFLRNLPAGMEYSIVYSCSRCAATPSR